MLCSVVVAPGKNAMKTIKCSHYKHAITNQACTLCW